MELVIDILLTILGFLLIMLADSYFYGKGIDNNDL